MNEIIEFIKANFWILILILSMIICKDYRGYGIILTSLQLTSFGRNPLVVFIVAFAAACDGNIIRERILKMKSTSHREDPDYKNIKRPD